MMIHAAEVPGPAMPVLFRLARHCNFGEHWAIVGSVEELGAWDTTKAARMRVSTECVTHEHCDLRTAVRMS